MIEPQFVGDVTWAETSCNTVQGMISSSWKKSAGGIDLKVRIPVGSTATIVIPAGEKGNITESGSAVKQSAEFTNIRTEAGKIFVDVTSGEYSFHADQANTFNTH